MPFKPHTAVVAHQAKSRRPNYTGTCFLIDQHYLDRKEELNWTTERLRRLCQAVQLTEYEIASLFRVRHGDMHIHLRQNRFSGPLTLHLANLEQFAFPLEGRRSLYPEDLLPQPRPDEQQKEAVTQ